MADAGSMTQLSLAHEAAGAHPVRRQGGIPVLCRGEIVGNSQLSAATFADADRGDQQARAALERLLPPGGVEYGHLPELEAGMVGGQLRLLLVEQGMFGGNAPGLLVDGAG